MLCHIIKIHDILPSLANSPLSLPPLPLPLSLPLPSRSHHITCLFPGTFTCPPLLRLSRSLSPEINTAPVTNSPFLLPSGDWCSFLSSYKSFDLLHITNRDFGYLHIASFSLCLSLSHFPSASSFSYTRYLSLWLRKIEQQSTVVAPRWRRCRSVKN